jgi:hypothetical protein
MQLPVSFARWFGLEVLCSRGDDSSGIRRPDLRTLGRPHLSVQTDLAWAHRSHRPEYVAAPCGPTADGREVGLSRIIWYFSHSISVVATDRLLYNCQDRLMTGEQI